MLELLKDYYIFMLILMVFSYLVPKQEYKGYIQFFVGIFMVVLFLEPVLVFLTADNPDVVSEIFDNINGQIEHVELKGENIFEFFFFKGEGK